MSNRKVIGPEIVQQRIDLRNQNNMWNYIAMINPRLEGNPIVGTTIIVVLDWEVGQHMIDQLVDTYTGVGWELDVGVGINETTFEFTVP